MPRGSTDEADFITWLSTWGFIFVGSERFLFDTMAWNLSGFSIILFVLSHLWRYCFVALIYVWIVADVFASILIMRFIGPFRALCVCVCVCVGGGGVMGGCGLYPGLIARCAHASPSALLYRNGKLQWHFTCGFNFRHGEGVKGCFKDKMKAYFCYVHTFIRC